MPSAYPQGVFSFSGGIPETSPLSFSVTHGHGLDPAIFHVRMFALPDVPEKNGDVAIRYGATEITFRDCTIDRIGSEAGSPLIWNVMILDRRYAWRLSRIDGAYNQRWKSGSELREETKKKPSELCRLCLDAMGETGYDLGAISQFDGRDWPETTWNNAWAANALQEMCERYGCRAIYTWQRDRVIIVKVGEGAELDLSGAIPLTEDAPEFNPPERPGRIVVRCAPTSVQADIPLVAVGVDTDATIKPIKQLSYAPGSPTFLQGQPTDFANGSYVDDPVGFWNTLNVGGYFEGLPAPYLRHLAAESIYRLYQIRPPKKMSGLNQARGDSAKDKHLPDLSTFPDVNKDSAASWLWRIALQSEQNDKAASLADPLNTTFDEYNKEVSSAALPAWVYGQYWNATAYANTLPDDLDANGDIVTAGILKLNPKSVVSPAQLNTSTLPGKEEPRGLSNRVISSGFCDVGFSVIPEWGLVKFSEPVYQQLSQKKDGVIALAADGTSFPKGVNNYPPALWLRTRFLLREPETRGWVRAERVRVLDPSNPITRYEVRDDLTLKMWYRPEQPLTTIVYPPRFITNRLTTNWDVVSKAADAYLDEIEKEYQTLTPQGVVYVGFVPLALDGAIREITWYVGGDRKAYTRAMRNQEYIVWHQDYAERRLVERQKAQLNQTPDPSPSHKPPPGVF